MIWHLRPRNLAGHPSCMENTEHTLYYSTSQVARLLQVSSEWVRHLSRNGTLPADLVTRNGRYWLPATVQTYLAWRRPQPAVRKGDADDCQD